MDECSHAMRTHTHTQRHAVGTPSRRHDQTQALCSRVAAVLLRENVTCFEWWQAAGLTFSCVFVALLQPSWGSRSAFLSYSLFFFFFFDVMCYNGLRQCLFKLFPVRSNWKIRCKNCKCSQNIHRKNQICVIYLFLNVIPISFTLWINNMYMQGSILPVWKYKKNMYNDCNYLCLWLISKFISKKYFSEWKKKI